LTLTNDQYRSELDAVVEEAKRELRSLFVKSEDQIKKVGRALKKVVKKEESICEEIKIALKEEIAEGVISTRTIELHCPPEWKRKTKPKQRENEKISFSKPQQQQIAATQEGKSVIVNEPSSNTNTSSDDVNQLHEQSKQNGIDINDNSEGQTTTNRGILHEPKANTEITTFVDLTSTDSHEKLPLDPSDKEWISHCIEFTIPKEKYGIVIAAMDKSKASIVVKFDGNNRFLSAHPDVYNGIPKPDISRANRQNRTVQQIQSDNVAKHGAQGKAISGICRFCNVG